VGGIVGGAFVVQQGVALPAVVLALWVAAVGAEGHIYGVSVSRNRLGFKIQSKQQCCMSLRTSSDNHTQLEVEVVRIQPELARAVPHLVQQL
jgi:Na+(H+)/acetate symporter ActP